MHKTIFLTGATGFLGAHAARKILSDDQVDLVVLVRANSIDAACHRLRRTWWEWPDLRAQVGRRVRVLTGDITHDRLGIPGPDYDSLARQLTHIIHCAAGVRLFDPEDELRRTNVDGTLHVLELARAVQVDHGLVRFAYVSTAYVCGDRSGPVAEDGLAPGPVFSNGYEASKYEAEQIVRRAGSELPVSIFRPGIIVGDSVRGAVSAFNTIYYPLRLYLTGNLRVMPASPSFKVEFTPVDYAAEAVVKLTFDPRAEGLTFHLTPPFEKLPRLDALMDQVRRWFEQGMNARLPGVVYLPLGGLEKAVRPAAGVLKGDLENLVRLLPYFRKQPEFSRENTDRLLGPYPYQWQDLVPTLLTYAVERSFWQCGQRTVYEQILLRLQSKTKPVRYHDHAGEGSLSPAEVQTGEAVRAQVLAAAAGLKTLGVGPGDRVAMLGPNSTRYFSLVTACGLIGAVSVPIYVTSPLADIDYLLADCQARVLLVGSPEVAAQADRLRFTGLVVDFSRQAGSQPARRGQLTWEGLIALGRGETADQVVAPVEMDDPAVLFYTSGTTGLPKAVVYRHEQLQWLAQTLASQYPWHERNRQGSYLSYLPVSHVVEGILAMYSPYFVPAALELHFLEDFKQLQAGLKKTRPTIFFSVPRFFEKVRAAVEQNRLYRLSQALPPGQLRRLLLRLIRRGVLRKTGLLECRQMMVGSAPSDPEMLKFFKTLGIEVHNAYGLTEAPLVSANLLGRNRADSVGQLLPETEISLEHEDEIWVRGPQVAAGYWVNGKIEPFENGWLRTGDTGSLTSDGYLVLKGRIKDVIITSYAKKINPTMLETRLRAIQGVEEAVLVGEGRPYCAALLWVEQWHDTCAAEIQACLNALNESLAHPEQVRRWAVLPGGLSAADGSLTGSMKVRRAVVSARYQEVIEALYAGGPVPGSLYAKLTAD